MLYAPQLRREGGDRKWVGGRGSLSWKVKQGNTETKAERYKVKTYRVTQSPESWLQGPAPLAVNLNSSQSSLGLGTTVIPLVVIVMMNNK